jgi:hypothetical protein
MCGVARLHVSRYFVVRGKIWCLRRCCPAVGGPCRALCSVSIRRTGLSQPQNLLSSIEGSLLVLVCSPHRGQEDHDVWYRSWSIICHALLPPSARAPLVTLAFSSLRAELGRMDDVMALVHSAYRLSSYRQLYADDRCRVVLPVISLVEEDTTLLPPHPVGG